MKRINLIILFVLTTGFTSGLVGRDFSIAVLPFLVEGKPEYARLDIHKSPVLLRDAASFLLGQDREIRQWNPSNYVNLLRQSKYNLKKPFQKENLRKVCLVSNSYYILGGSAYFTKQSVTFTSKVYSCRLNQILGYSRIKKGYSKFQQALRIVIRKSTPFINPLRKINTITTTHNSAIDMAVILDTSGSMNTMMPMILSALKTLKHSLPRGSRIGLILLKEGAKQEIIPFTKDWTSTLKIIMQTQPRGRIYKKDLLSALQVVERYNRWKFSKNLLIFTDLSFASRRQGTLESTLRRITQNRIRTRVFPMVNNNHSDHLEWKRIARAVKLEYINVTYGKKIYPLGRNPYYILFGNNRFYTSRSSDDIAVQIKSGSLHYQSLLSLPTTTFAQEELSLETLSRSYPKMMNQKVSSVGPLLSDLEQAIHKSIRKNKGGLSHYKILVKNKGNSFWIPVAQHGVIQKIKNSRGREFFIGLHIKKNKHDHQISTMMHPIYIRNHANVPRLYITSWKHLHRVPIKNINPADIWFLKVELVEVKSP